MNVMFLSQDTLLHVIFSDRYWLHATETSEIKDGGGKGAEEQPSHNLTNFFKKKKEG